MGDTENVSSHKPPEAMILKRKKRLIPCNHRNFPQNRSLKSFPSEDDTKSISKPKKPQTTLQFTIIVDYSNCLIFGSVIKIMLWDLVCFTAKKWNRSEGISESPLKNSITYSPSVVLVFKENYSGKITMYRLSKDLKKTNPKHLTTKITTNITPQKYK